MKILLFLRYYDTYVERIYKKNSYLKDLSYDQQLEFILSDFFGWPPSLMKSVQDLGHQVEILIVNVEPLQKAWAKENDFDFSTGDWKYNIPIQQVKQFKPDILWIASIFNYFGEYLGILKPFCKKIFAWTACPFPSSLNLSYINCFLTSHTNFQDYFQQHDKQCEILLPTFDKRIIDTLGEVDQDIECSFVGSLSWAHIERIRTIRELADKTAVQIWGDRSKLLSRGIIKPGFIQSYLSLYPIRHKILPSVWGMDMYSILARSRITINVHGEVASGLAGNMRMFEATGMGSLLITEDAPNIRELYEPGVEVVTYKGIENLIDIINYYIDQPRERESIAKAGQSRTFLTHSTEERSKELVEIFDRYLNS